MIVKQRSKYFEDADVIAAEITIAESGETFFIYGEYSQEADDVYTSVSRDSILDMNVRIIREQDPESVDRLIKRRWEMEHLIDKDTRDRLRKEYRGSIIAMLREEAQRNGLTLF